jgi:hypothetical protein
MWVSKDEGRTWQSTSITPNTDRNHSYVRNVVGAHPDFYAFWADVNHQTGKSRLYFASKEGDVRQLPYDMEGGFAEPAWVRRAKP